MPQYFIVWNADRTEGFITDSADDASKAAGRMHPGGIESTLGAAFRDCYADNGKPEVQPAIINKPLSKAAEKLLKRIQDGAWYRPHEKNTPKAMQELIEHKLVFVMGRVVTLEAAYVAQGHTPFVMDKPPGAPSASDID